MILLIEYLVTLNNFLQTIIAIMEKIKENIPVINSI